MNASEYDVVKIIRSRAASLNQDTLEDGVDDLIYLTDLLLDYSKHDESILPAGHPDHRCRQGGGYCR